MNILATAQKNSLIFQNEFLEIHFDRSFSLLTLAWSRQITFDERVIGYEAAFEFLMEFEIENILINNEKIFLFSATEKAWLANFLSEKMRKTNLKKFALVTSDIYKTMGDLYYFIELQKRIQVLAQLEYEFFIDMETARIWICPNQDL